MATDSNLTTGSEVVAKAGSGYSIAFDSHIAKAMEQAEGVFNTVCGYDFSAIGASGLGSSTKGLCSDVVSALAANQAIAFDMSGYPSRIVAEDMINVNRDTALRGMSILRDKNRQKFVTDSSVGTV